jgi:hypothetical protein
MYFSSDIAFLNELSIDFEQTLIKKLSFDPNTDHIIIEKLRKKYKLYSYS